MDTFDEYLIQGEVSQKQRAEHWQIAIGLQAVDRLKPSPYLLDLAKQHIEGAIDLAAAKNRITEYYQTEAGRQLIAERTNEADLVATRIMAILAEDTFAFIPATYAHLHRRLFEGIFPHAGHYRTVNISKREWVLDGESVTYAPYDLLAETIDYDFAQERQFSYQNVPRDEALKHICKFISGLWQIHPFREGNTRTTALFAILYLRRFGFQVSNEPFKAHSWYFRNALVRANYNNYALGITSTTRFLERFFENLIFRGTHELKSRFCHIHWSETKAQSAISKCKICTLEKPSCTLEEAAVLEFLAQHPEATQKQVAEAIGKSERTVKTLTKTLQEQGLLSRKNGKRNGTWCVTTEPCEHLTTLLK